jgi:uncharacterized protein YqeY
MSLKQKITDAQIIAMKSKETETLSTLRMLLSAIKNVEIEKRKELDDNEIIEVVARQVKQLKDALKDFEAGGREDLVQKTNKEIDLLEKYLPEKISDNELSEIIKSVIAETGASSPADLGKVIGAVMKKVKGRVDGNVVREKILEVLNK